MSFRFVIINAFWILLAGSPVDAQPLPSWNIGDSWPLAVEFFPRGAVQKGGSKATMNANEHLRYNMNVVILGQEAVDGLTCSKVDFLIPSKKPPAGLTGRYRCCVDAKDGWARKIFSFRDYRPIPLEHFATARLLATAPDGYPVEILPPTQLKEVKSVKSSSTLTLINVKETGLRTALVRDSDNKEVEIRQVWKEGEKWWHHYERYRDGRLELKAQRLDQPTPAQPSKTTSLSKPSASPLKVKLSSPSNKDADDSLQEDPRLKVRLTLRLSKPKIQELLDELTKKTGLLYSVDEHVDQSAPVFASCTWANMEAGWAMRKIAESPAIQGKWEKGSDGYRLLGSRTTSPVPLPDNTRILLTTALVVSVAVAIGLMGILALRRKKVHDSR